MITEATVSSTRFGFYAADEVREVSTVEIVSSTTFDTLNQPVEGGLYDLRMGPTEKGVICPSCNELERDCVGHLGHIELPVPCYNPLTFGLLHKLLQVKCFHCHELRLDKIKARCHAARCRLLGYGEFQQAEELGLDASQDAVEAAELFLKSLKKGRSFAHARAQKKEAQEDFWKALRSANICAACGATARKVRKDGATKFFRVEPNSVDRDKGLGISAAKSARKSLAANADEEDGDDSEPEEEIAPQSKKDQFMDAGEVLAQTELLWRSSGSLIDAVLGVVESREDDDDEEKAASSPERLFFVRVIAVPPPRFRPSQTVNDRLVEHPQNVVLAKIVSVCDRLRKSEEPGELVAQWLILQNEVNGFVDSSKSQQPQSAPPGLKQLLERKEGLFRKHMMGKRVNFCARSVISPDNFLSNGEVGLPLRFAKGLSYPEPVTAHNVEMLRKMVENGTETWPGANYVELNASGRSRVDLGHVKSREKRAAMAKQLLTTPGQVVGRHVVDGDWVLVNRQPTLHKPGIMAHSAKILRHDNQEALRLHYANCNAYNADFDGDEVNCHLVQNELARAEAKYVMATSEQYMVATNGKPLRGLIQDHVDSAVKLSCQDCLMERELFCHFAYEACRSIVGDRGSVDVRIAGTTPCVLKPTVLYSGKQLLSVVVAHVTSKFSADARRVPPYLKNFTSKAKVSSRAISQGARNDLDENIVLFRNGQFLRGIIDKASIGASSNGLVHAVYELYGSRAAASLLDALSRLLTIYLRDLGGHTCGLDDLVLTADAERQRRKLVDEAEEKGLQAFDAFIEETFGDERTFKTRNAAMAAVYALPDGGKLLDSAMQAALAPIHSDIVKACLPNGLKTLFPKNSFSMMVTTGAKGSTVNQSQISCALGQQSLEGRRVPLTATGKSLPCFEPYDPSPRAGGLVLDRFLTGLRPQEYYFHCMAGREGLIDTAVKTSRSGYLQRCLVKHLEDLAVAYDHTVRDAEGSVVQFLYGDDGLDPTKAALLDGNHFQFLYDNAMSENDADEVEDAVPEEVKIARNGARSHKVVLGSRVFFSKNGGRRSTYGTVVKMRKGATKCDLRFDDGTIQKRVLLTEVKLAGDLEDPVSSRFFPHVPGCVSDRVAEAIAGESEKCRQLIFERYSRALAAPGEAVGAVAAQSVGEPSTQMTLNTFHLAGHGAGNVTLGIPRLREIIMTASSTIKTPIVVLPYSKECPNAADEAKALASRLNRVVLADLLDTEHGVRAVERVVFEGGYIYRHYTATFRLHRQTQISRHFGSTFVRDYCEAHKISGNVQDAVRKALVSKFVSEERAAGITSTTTTTAAARRPAPAAAEEAEPSAAQLLDEMDDDDDADVEEEDRDEELVGTEVIRTVTGYDDDDDDEGDDDEGGDSDDRKEEEATETLVSKRGKEKANLPWKKRLTVTAKCSLGDDERLSCEVVCLVPGSRPRVKIAEILRSTCNNVVVRAASAGVSKATAVDDHKVDGVERGAIIVQGRDFEALWEESTCHRQDCVDLDTLESNDIAAILHTYGVEAARACIVREINAVFGVYGIVVGARHLSLIADKMTFYGGYHAMNRQAMGLNSSPYLQMSFETTAAFLTNAAVTGDTDYLESPSASIVLGQPPKLGTNTFELLADLTPPRSVAAGRKKQRL